MFRNIEARQIEIRSNLDVSENTVLMILDFEGKTLNQNTLTRNVTRLDLKSTQKRSQLLEGLFLKVSILTPPFQVSNAQLG